MALCAALLVLCIVLAAGWSKAAKTNTAALPEVRNNGTAIQWRYPAEEEWRDLVSLTELRGAVGENGKNGTDGKNGLDGKDGIDGKNGADGINGKNGINGKKYRGTASRNPHTVALRRRRVAKSCCDSRYRGPAGQNGTDGANGKTPEFRVNENILQWRYVDDEIWLNLYDLSVLKGLDGKDGINGQNGSDGKDGKTPFIGENGNWWIGTTDTGVKAAGVDGGKGDKRR